MSASAAYFRRVTGFLICQLSVVGCCCLDVFMSWLFAVCIASIARFSSAPFVFVFDENSNS